MSQFPMSEIGGIAVSRLVAGTNWFLGYSHQTHTKSQWIKQFQTRQKISEVLQVFMRAGINVTIAPMDPLFTDALSDAQQAVGTKMHWISTPIFGTEADGPNWDAANQAFDQCAESGATFCWPHTSVTDRLYDGLSNTIRHMDRLTQMIRRREMIPGLSTHRPEVIRVADKTQLDVASYVCIYNSAGFLMPVEIDWTLRVIQGAQKPVTTIKPMAAGRVMPYVGLPFVWSTLRDCDLVCAGTTTPDEAAEVIEISLACIEKRQANRTLQTTRSKKTLEVD